MTIWLLLAKLGLCGGHWLLNAAGSAIGWLFEKQVRFVVALVLAATAYHLAFVDPALRSKRDSALKQVAQLAVDVSIERRAHAQTKLNYRAAQAEAARLEAARLERVKVEQQEITDEVSADYRRRLADARAAAERLRAGSARAGEHPAGPGGAQPLPAAGNPAGRADGPPADHGLPLDERLVATEQALQLNALISWVERQAGVRFNP
jgi:hypothetical protein